MFSLRNVFALLLAVVFAVTALVFTKNPSLQLWPLFELLTVIAAVVFYLPGAIAAIVVSLLVGVFKLPQALTFTGLVNFLRLALIGSLIGWYASKQKEQAQKLNNLAMVDRLTDLYNYSYFLDRLAEEKKRSDRFGSRLSLIMLDIDHFKAFNDKFGHQQGNELLKQVAKVIQAQIRSVDIPVRYGGEEFAVLLPNTGRVAAAEVAERLRKAVTEATFTLSGQKQQITISAGVAVYPLDASNELELIDKVDEALLQAKESGRNKVVVYTETVEGAVG